MKIKSLAIATVVSMTTFMFACGSEKKAEEKKDSTEQEPATETTEATDAPKMEEFVSEKGNFTINFPGTPKETVKSEPTAVGNIEITMFMYEASLTKVFVVGLSDYPSDLVKASNTDDLLKGAQGGVVTSMGATIESEAKSEFEGHPALSFKAKANTYYMDYKLILVNNRLYQIGILQDGSPVSEEETKAFIGSFKLNKAQ